MFTSEEWRDVVGYEGVYQVSSRGRIMRIAGAGPGAKAGRILKYTPGQNGYTSVNLSVNNIARTHKVHRLVLAAFVGECPTGYVVNHINGKRDDNRLDNLEYITQGENNNHAINTLGFQFGKRGEQHSQAKLSEKQVAEIRRLLHSGEFSQKEIARRFGVAPNTISQIATNKRWKHIDYRPKPGILRWIQKKLFD